MTLSDIFPQQNQNQLPQVKSQPQPDSRLFDYTPRDLGEHTSNFEKYKDYGADALFELLNLADRNTTRQSVMNSYEESFPKGMSEVIGKHPSGTRATELMGVEALAFPFLNKLSEPYRSILQTLLIGAKASAV